MNHKSRPMGSLSPLILAASLATALPASSAIVFSNSDLEGGLGVSSVPSGWEIVPFDAPFSEATTVTGASTDTVGATGPNIGAGIYGAPHSGDSFVGGAHGFITAGGIGIHEGLQQTVSGFTVGEEYSFSFFQANAGLSSRQDTEGSWRVYANGTLITTTAPTSTSLAWNDPAKALAMVWEERFVTFTATAESMTLSFMPYDTDGDISGLNGIYMGIDTFSPIFVPEPSVAMLGVIGLLGLMRRRR